MRQIHENERGTRGLVISLALSVAFTAILFGIIPFTHIVAKPGRELDLRKTNAAELPPPKEPEPAPPPPTESEPPPEPPPAPQLADVQQDIPLTADLDVAVGAGGSLAGFGESMTFATADAIQDAAFELADLERQPEPLSQTAPAYPPELRKARIEGSVTLIFVLSEDGRVEDPRIESSSRPEFEKPALDAVRKWRFKPGLKDGNPVRTYLRLPMRFKIHS